jgi:aspartyl protease family protein
VARTLWTSIVAAGLIITIWAAQEQKIPWASSSGALSRPMQIALLLFFLLLILTLPGRKISRAIFSVSITFVCAIAYIYDAPLRLEELLGGVFPGRAATRLVQIEHAGAANLALTAEINGAQVPMVLDTGATSVVLSQEAAKAAGLPLEVLTYTVTIETANGRARAAPVTLDRIAIGGILERAVPALILPPGQLRTSLLGMSFLNRLQSWEVRGERLLIRGYP